VTRPADRPSPSGASAAAAATRGPQRADHDEEAGPPIDPVIDPAVASAVDAAAALLGLPIDPAHRPGVLRYWAMAASMARIVSAVPLGRDDESGAVFRPVEPERTPDGR
jgi:hypothetical protein